MSYLTPVNFNKIVQFPASMPETELRRSKNLIVGTYVLAAGQRLQLKSLNLHVCRILNPGLVLDLMNSVGAVSVGLYQATMLTGALALVTRSSTGVSAYNTFKSCEAWSQGTYIVMVSNNTRNIDFSVSVNGSVKLFL